MVKIERHFFVCENQRPAAGKMASFFRSVVGYMLPTSAGRSFPSHAEVAATDIREGTTASSEENCAV